MRIIPWIDTRRGITSRWGNLKESYISTAPYHDYLSGAVPVSVRWAPCQKSSWSRQLPQQVHHFNRRQCCFESLVAAFGAGPVDGLLQRVAGQYAEDDRHAGRQR